MELLWSTEPINPNMVVKLEENLRKSKRDSDIFLGSVVDEIDHSSPEPQEPPNVEVKISVNDDVSDEVDQEESKDKNLFVGLYCFMLDHKEQRAALSEVPKEMRNSTSNNNLMKKFKQLFKEENRSEKHRSFRKKIDPYTSTLPDILTQLLFEQEVIAALQSIGCITIGHFSLLNSKILDMTDISEYDKIHLLKIASSLKKMFKLKPQIKTQMKPIIPFNYKNAMKMVSEIQKSLNWIESDVMDVSKRLDVLMDQM